MLSHAMLTPLPFGLRLGSALLRPLCLFDGPPALDTVMGHAQYQLGLRWWLGLPLAPDMPAGELCPKCHTTVLDPFGDHLM